MKKLLVFLVPVLGVFALFLIDKHSEGKGGFYLIHGIYFFFYFPFGLYAVGSPSARPIHLVANIITVASYLLVRAQIIIQGWGAVAIMMTLPVVIPVIFIISMIACAISEKGARSSG